MALEKACRTRRRLITVSGGALWTPIRWKIALRALASAARTARRYATPSVYRSGGRRPPHSGPDTLARARATGYGVKGNRT